MTYRFIICKGINITGRNFNLLEINIFIAIVITLETHSIIHYERYDQQVHIQICKFTLF
jgi:hypothetical protein